MNVSRNHRSSTGLKSLLDSLYIFSLPFLSAFGFFSFLSLPLLVSGFRNILALPNLAKSVKAYSLLPLLVILFGLLPIIIFGVNSKTLNHVMAFSSSYLFYYFLFVVNPLKVTFKALLKYISLATMLYALYIIFEFVLRNYFAIDPAKYIPFIGYDPEGEDPIFFGNLIRPRGLSLEAGHSAMFFSIGIPFTLYYLRKFLIFKKAIFIGVSLLGYLLLIPTASIVSTILSIVFVGFFSNVKVKYKISMLLLVFAFFSAFAFIPGYFSNTIGARLSDTNSSSQGRIAALNNAIDYVKENPLGYGWGFLSSSSSENVELSGSLNLYVELIVASGVQGLLIFLAWLFFTYREIKRLQNRLLSLTLTISLISILFHYFFIHNYWFPYLWFAALMPFIARGEQHV